MLLFERYLLVSRLPLETSPNLGMSPLRRTRAPSPPLSATHPEAVALAKRLHRASPRPMSATASL